MEGPSCRPPEIWAGIECTRNRVGGRIVDQLERSGHAGRASDLDLLAGLGVTAVRYPVLWERVEGAGLRRWAWADARLGRLRDLGIRPVVGLLHHGGGPHPEGMLDPKFPERFAEYAGAFARRYPWVDAYIPINEPLTTARFSGLYGVWEPHLTDPRAALRMFLNQCRGFVLAAEAIRESNPDAEIISNEDVGRVLSTPALAYQAAFENERRWLTFDVLTGGLTPDRPMWRSMVRGGATPEELRWFLARPDAISTLAVDHYCTSDRYLDEDYARYPRWARGGNRRHRYANVHASRADVEAPGLAGAVRDTAGRYRHPLIMGELHMGDVREEQLRWLAEAWDVAVAEGVRAITVWSAFGSFDWNTLLTRDAGVYESGAFDISGDEPRPTAVAEQMRRMAAGLRPEHAVLETQGWWRRPGRVHLPCRRAVPRGLRHDGRFVAISPGPLAALAVAVCRRRGLACRVVPPTAREAPGAWARIEAGKRTTSALRAPAVPTLEVDGTGATRSLAASLDRGLDLLIDGAAGTWCAIHANASRCRPECVQLLIRLRADAPPERADDARTVATGA